MTIFQRWLAWRYRFGSHELQAVFRFMGMDADYFGVSKMRRGIGLKPSAAPEGEQRWLKKLG